MKWPLLSTKPYQVIFGPESVFTGLDALTAKVQVPVLMRLFYPTPFLNWRSYALPPCSSILRQSLVCLSLTFAPICLQGPRDWAQETDTPSPRRLRILKCAQTILFPDIWQIHHLATHSQKHFLLVIMCDHWGSSVFPLFGIGLKFLF